MQGVIPIHHQDVISRGCTQTCIPGNGNSFFFLTNIFDSFVNESENQPITKSMVLSWQTWAMKNDIPYFFKNVADMHDLYLVCQPRINQLTICMSKAGPNEWVHHLNEKEIKGGQSNESN